MGTNTTSPPLIETNYSLRDGRYYTDPDRAVCYEVCDTLKEARKTAPDYGTDTVIVKTVLKHISGNRWQEVSSEIVK